MTNITSLVRPAIIAVLMLFSVSVNFQAFAQAENSSLGMYVGDTQVLNLGVIERIAIGQASIISTSILDAGQLLILAEGTGETEMTVWLANGNIFVYKIRVDSNDISRVYSEIEQLLNSLPTVTQRRVGNRIVLEGSVDEAGKSMVGLVAGLYSENVVDMTDQAQVGSQKMIYMKVQITEFNTNKLKTLGINWQSSFRGPTAGYVNEDLSINSVDGDRSVLSQSVGPTGLTEPLGLAGSGIVNVVNQQFGFFGIASRITSTINLAANNGDALILAEPALSARSGGEANFLSGGEVPLPVIDALGQQNVEFKEFGIKLRIQPQADDLGNIIAEVETELSTVDPSLAVNNIPGFRTRKVSTDASLKDGETLVISGLISRELSENTEGLAYLSQIPVLGALFRSEDFRNQKSELVIFVTPYIFDEDSEIHKEALQRGTDLRQEFLENIDKTSDILD